ncbi:trypsin-like peptidase domain-containing protein [Oscillospiraceae bacterium OttesenSCG-928-G22]|nr:trypsin-like peptidase domain-containing protein [Oscillospiraceae bacterium OttesenSCG-928-G22]
MDEFNGPDKDEKTPSESEPAREPERAEPAVGEEHVPYYRRTPQSPIVRDISSRRVPENVSAQYRPEPEKKTEVTEGFHWATESARTGTVRQKKRKKKRSVLLSLFITLIVMSVAATLIVGFSLYEVSFIRDENGMHLSIEPRYPRNNSLSDPPLVTVSASPAPSGETADPRPIVSPEGENGPELSIVDVPQPDDTDGEGETETGAARRELSIPEISDKCLPSVVGIRASTTSAFGQTGMSSGSGVIMDAGGYIITNYHVIEGATSIEVVTMDGRTFDATITGQDQKADLAVVRIEATGLVAAEFGNSDALRVGEDVIAIGNPLGIELMGTVTDGIVSAINRDVVVDGRVMSLIQTNAAINPGNSGGPLINKYGQVIGINTLKMYNYYANVEGLGFAIPSNTTKEIVDELIRYGYVTGRPAIGITGRALSKTAADTAGLPAGVLVEKIDKSSDAYRQGIRAGDVIVAAEGTDVLTVPDINAAKSGRKVGDTLTLTLYRDGDYFDVTFKLMDEIEVTQ